MTVLYALIWILYILACLFLVFVVLIQKGEGGGFSGLGGGAVDKAFGSKADLTWKRWTAASAAIYMTGAIAIGILQNHASNRSELEDQSETPKIGAVSPADDGPPATGS